MQGQAQLNKQGRKELEAAKGKSLDLGLGFEISLHILAFFMHPQSITFSGGCLRQDHGFSTKA